MLNKRLINLFLLAGLFFSAHGQDLKFSDPVKLGAALNTPSEELNPVISPDGKEIYFARAFYEGNVGGAYTGMDIWTAEKRGRHEWSPATNNFSSLNSKDNNAVIGIASDGKVLYLLNSYNNKNGIAFSKALFNGWSNPEVIDVPDINNTGFTGFYMSPSYDVLLIAMDGEESFGSEDLYVSLKNASGQWEKPINLGSTINTGGFEISPFLSKDKKRLYFASDGHPGYGDADIFVAERLYDSWTVWSTPKNLGSKINSEGFDAYLTIAEDSTVIFASNRSGGLSDLYGSTFLGYGENPQLALKESLIREAKNILAELRGEAHRKDYFIEFGEQSAEITGEGKTQLSALVKDLNYQDYGQISLVSFEGKSENDEVHTERIKNITNYLKLSGINEEKIRVNRSKQMTDDVANALFDNARGVLIIVSKTN